MGVPSTLAVILICGNSGNDVSTYNSECDAIAARTTDVHEEPLSIVVGDV